MPNCLLLPCTWLVALPLLSYPSLTTQLSEKPGRLGVADAAPGGAAGGGGGTGLPPGITQDVDEDKYARRVHPLRRLLQRWLPALLAAPGLPVTSK
jgi:hypothetical protein